MEAEKAKTSKTRKTLGTIVNVIIWLFIAFSVVVTILAITANTSKDGVPSIGGKVMSPVLSNSMAPTFYKGDMIFSNKITDESKKNLDVMDVVTFRADLDGDGSKEINTHRIIEVIGSDDAVSYRTKGDNEGSADSYTISWSDVISVVNLGSKTTEIKDEAAKAKLSKGTIISATTGEDAKAGMFLIKEVNKEDGKVVSYTARSIYTSEDDVVVKVADVQGKFSEKISRVGGLGSVVTFLTSSTGFLVCIVIPLVIFFLFEIVMFVKRVLEIKNANKKKITVEEEELIKQRAIEEYIRQQQGAAKPAEGEAGAEQAKEAQADEPAAETEAPAAETETAAEAEAPAEAEAETAETAETAEAEAEAADENKA